MNILKRLFGIAPQPTEDGAFKPSRLALMLATSSKTDFDDSHYSQAYQGNKRVMMLCTEQRNMTMKNGTKFSTGNHPVEMLVPMLHLKRAGFDIDIYTPTGKSVKIEMWAMPKEDKAVMELYQEYQELFEKPKSLEDFVAQQMEGNDDYCAVFIPGGHGAMLGLSESRDLSKLIYWVNKEDLFMLSICHGPAALLSASLDSSEPFPYAGYKVAVFPDSADRQSPMIGYMPGHLAWAFGAKLKALGVNIINKGADKTCCVDRKLITGASPKAANDFGKLCAEELLKHIK